MVSIGILKAPANDETLSMFPEMFSRRANEETFVEEAKFSEKNSELLLLPQQMFPGAANGKTFASETMF